MMIDQMDQASLSIRSAENEGDPLAMYSSNESAWERGLDCISSILQPGSKSLAALSKEQQIGLKDLKAMMISAAVDGNGKNHIPQALLDTPDDANSNYLLSEYAGINTRPSAAITSMNKVLSAQKVALKFKKIALKTLKAQSTGSSEFVTLKNMPEYWHELDKHSKLKLKDLLSWDNICRWDFNIFDVDELLKGKNTLVFVSWAIIASPHAQYAMEMSCNEFSGRSSKHIEGLKTRRGYHFMSSLKIREKTLIGFLTAIEDRYNADVKYHNYVHAADVTQSLHVLLQMGAKNFTEEKLELFSMLIAAVVHDVGHSGLNNTFHVNSRSELALVYNDVSVLENMHVSSAFRLILGDGRDRRLDIFENFDEEQTTKARDFITKAVLSTDMKKHFATLNAIKGIIFGVDDIGMMLSTELPNDLCLRTEILTFIIHLADISNPSKDLGLARIWTDRLLEECFKQGDLEESMGLPFSPLCDRSTTNREKSQISFINFVVLPSYELLGKLIPRVENEVVPILHDNLKYWKEQDVLVNGIENSPKPKKKKKKKVKKKSLIMSIENSPKPKKKTMKKKSILS